VILTSRLISPKAPGFKEATLANHLSWKDYPRSFLRLAWYALVVVLEDMDVHQHPQL
jgi:hypothetical protein